MKKIALFVVLVLSAFILQCSKGNADGDKYSCQTDTDCLNSCSQGSVSAQWYSKKFDIKRECNDGCAGSWSSPPRCVDQMCTAFQFGQYNAYCTKGPKPKDSILLELTKYSCSSDFDCTVSCGQGAVNQTWYKKNGGSKSDCVDGCAADGFDSKCEKHICEAYLEGKKYPGCTRK